MKLSLSMWSVHKLWYEGKWDTVDFIDFAAQTKANGVELLSCFWKDREAEMPAIREALARHQLEVACFCACNNMISSDEKIRKEQIKEVTDAVDAALYFQAPVVRVFSGDKYDDSISYEQAFQYVIDGLKEAAAYAEKKGVTLCLENHGLFAGRSDQVLDIIHRVGSDALRSTFDCGNFLLVGQNPSEAADALCTYVKHVHVKDFKKVPKETDGFVLQALTGEYFLGKIAGQGDVDLPYIFSRLKDAGYNGWYTIEFEGNEDPLEGSVSAVNYAYNLLSQH